MRRILGHILPLALAVAIPAVAGAAQTPAPRLSGSRLETVRHVLTLAPSGLPQQLAIKATAAELPLGVNGARVQLEPAKLISIGRGAQLAAPIRLVATIDGQEVVAEPRKPAKPELDEGAVICESSLAAGRLMIDLKLRYERDGALLARVTYGSKAKVEALALVVTLEGTVDQIVAGSPVGSKVQRHTASHFTVGGQTGLIWGNSASDATKTNGRALPGLVSHAYVGNGDRGFTWLADEAGDWELDKAASSMTLERDQAGRVVWRSFLANRSSRLKKKATVSFALMPHPAAQKPADHRKRSWLNWPFKDETAPTLPLTLKTRGELASQGRALLRAEAAAAFEGACQYSLLQGPAGGDALSAELHHAKAYPMSLFRYLAGSHTGLTVRLQSNAAKLTNPGSARAPDRVLLGRALLHDIGLDAKSLAHLADAARVVSALQEFGYFEEDGATEFVPYWRSGRLLRFGEPFGEEDAFLVHEKNPLAQVYVSIYRRPHGRRGTKALIVIANESDRNVRDQLYVLDPPGLWGGPNRLSGRAITAAYDFSAMPDRSDWGKPGMMSTARFNRDTVLKDLADDGVVGLAAAKDGIEAYGPHIFIPAHDFRIFYGHGRK